eukprot:161635-Pleurochrysis_carterae.AAC.2
MERVSVANVSLPVPSRTLVCQSYRRVACRLRQALHIQVARDSKLLRRAQGYPVSMRQRSPISAFSCEPSSRSPRERGGT